MVVRVSLITSPPTDTPSGPPDADGESDVSRARRLWARRRSWASSVVPRMGPGAAVDAPVESAAGCVGGAGCPCTEVLPATLHPARTSKAIPPRKIWPNDRSVRPTIVPTLFDKDEACSHRAKNALSGPRSPGREVESGRTAGESNRGEWHHQRSHGTAPALLTAQPDRWCGRTWSR